MAAVGFAGVGGRGREEGDAGVEGESGELVEGICMRTSGSLVPSGRKVSMVASVTTKMFCERVFTNSSRGGAAAEVTLRGLSGIVFSGSGVLVRAWIASVGVGGARSPNRRRSETISDTPVRALGTALPRPERLSWALDRTSLRDISRLACSIVVSMVAVAFLKRPVKKEPAASRRGEVFWATGATSADLSPDSIKSSKVSGCCGREWSEGAGLVVADCAAEDEAVGGGGVMCSGVDGGGEAIG